MTEKEYFRQAYRLDHRINSDIEEMERLREMAKSVSSPCLEERFNPNRATEAPFAKCIIRLIEMEQKINEEINRFVDLKEQMHGVIDALADTNEMLVLRYRYIHNETWDGIAAKLHADRSSVRRWHASAMKHVALPAEPIII